MKEAFVKPATSTISNTYIHTHIFHSKQMVQSSYKGPKFTMLEWKIVSKRIEGTKNFMNYMLIKESNQMNEWTYNFMNYLLIKESYQMNEWKNQRAILHLS